MLESSIERGDNRTNKGSDSGLKEGEQLLGTDRVRNVQETMASVDARGESKESPEELRNRITSAMDEYYAMYMKSLEEMVNKLNNLDPEYDGLTPNEAALEQKRHTIRDLIDEARVREINVDSYVKLMFSWSQTFGQATKNMRDSLWHYRTEEDDRWKPHREKNLRETTLADVIRHAGYDGFSGIKGPPRKTYLL
jgi:hypothetical protein